ncbi:MAG: hypothetical protein H7239_01085 [Flavobacterium sp.]|nr:hypothetical protein [Flavobacterium sp.]
MNEFTITDLDHNPLLKNLLITYSVITYEEHAILDDHHLLMEYYLLKKNNELHFLFETEKLANNFQKLC